MPVPSHGAFAERLRGLSAADLRAFVADLWRVRGYDVREEGAVVVATREDDHLELFPSVGRRLRGPTRPPSSASPDVVVDGSGRASAVAGECDAAYVGPDDLYDRLLYGLDRDVAERLLDRHLDAPLSVDRGADAATDTGPSARTAERGGADGPTADDGRIAAPTRLRPDAGSPTAVVVVVGAAVLAAVVAGLGPGGVTGLLAAGDDAGPGATPPPTPGASTNGSATDDGSDGDDGAGTDVGALGATPDYPPGVSASAVNGRTLALAHDRYVSNRSYRWRSVRRVSGGLADNDWDEVRTLARSGDGGRYRARSVGVARAPNDTGVTYAYYGTGNHTYVRTDDEDGVDYDRRPPDPNRRTAASWQIERFLGAGGATVAGSRVEGERAFEVVVSDLDAGWVDGGANVSDYRAVALVRPSGFVVSMNVSYDLTRAEQSGTVRYSFRYDDVGNVTVEAPPWLDEAREATGGSSTPPSASRAAAAPVPAPAFDAG